LYSVDPFGSDHDAAMRIGSEAPGRQAQSRERRLSHGLLRVTATSDRHRRPVTIKQQSTETFCFP